MLASHLNQQGNCLLLVGGQLTLEALTKQLLEGRKDKL